MDSNIYKEEEITREILLKEYEIAKKTKPNNNWYYRECFYCGKPKQVSIEINYGNYTDEKTFAIDLEKHKICEKIAKYEKLSIFDKLHKQNTFENASILNEKENAYINSFKRYCDNFEKAKEQGVGLLFTGNAGNGKTFYSNCIANNLKEKGYSVLSFNLSGYMQELRKFNEKEKEKELLGAVETVDLVIIDDVGSENITEWGQEKMFNLFNTIYLYKKSCIVTTNNNASELEKHLIINGSNKILDRLLELCKPFKFDWESRRKTIGQEKFKDIF